MGTIGQVEIMVRTAMEGKGGIVARRGMVARPEMATRSGTVVTRTSTKRMVIPAVKSGDNIIFVLFFFISKKVDYF